MSQKRQRGVPWNWRQVQDVWNMVHRTTAFMAQIQKMQSMIMTKPFKLHINGIPHELDDDMQYLAKTDWMTTVKDMFIWKICFGIVPYFLVTIDGTAHSVPKVPIFNSGTILTYENEKHRQQFEWEWDATLNRKEYKIYWLYTGYEPNLDGSLRSPAAACLDAYEMMVKARTDALYANFHRTHPLTVYEDRPPKTNRDEHYEHTQFNMYGEDVVERFMQEETHDSEARVRYMRSDEVEEQLLRAGILNERQVSSRLRKPVLSCKGAGHDMEREVFVHNNVILPADRHYAGHIDPALLLDPFKATQDLFQQAAEIVGIPLELTQSQSRAHASNQRGIMMAMSEVLKSHINWLDVALTRMYRNIYGKTIQRGWDLRRTNGDYRLYPPPAFRSYDGQVRNEMQMENAVDIEVHLQGDPRTQANAIFVLYEKQFMTKKHAAEQLARITGLPDGVIQALPEPSRQKKQKTAINDDDQEEMN